jgi:hypothetical protein
MKSIVAIRTHRWTEAEDRLLGQLRAAFGDDVVVVFHERAPDVTPGCEVVDLNAAWAQEQGLRTPRDWGWRCGDYFFYALRAARPDYDHYWLVEPDVLFLGDPAAFFARFAQVEDDILGLDPEPMNAAKRMFVASMPGMDHWRAIFALTRISGRALDRLLPLRQENSKAPVGQMRFANDEAFVYSHAMAEDDLRVGNLRDHAPEWFEGAPFDTAPDMIEEAVLDRDDLRGKVLHPVHGKAAFKAEIAKRATKRLNFFENLGESLDYLDDSDLEEIADDLRRRALNTMHQFKRKRRKAIRQARMQRAAE